MATKKKRTQAEMASPSYLANVKKGTVQAGKPKASGMSRGAIAIRKTQNKGVKDGTIRLGRSGKSYNVYDAASGTWKRGVVKAAPARSVPAKATGGYKPASGGTYAKSTGGYKPKRSGR